MIIIHHLLALAVSFQIVVTDFDCQPENKPISSDFCDTELKCIYDGGYEDMKGYRRYCTCKTVISDVNLPNNKLNYNLFKMICARNDSILQQLWINEAELEYIDNEIFEKYPNLKDVNLAGNNIILNFSRQAKQLTELDVSYNELMSLTNYSFNNLTSLRSLDISFNKLYSLDIAWCFLELQVLEELYLNDNYLSKIKFNGIHNLTKLKILRLDHNFLRDLNLTWLMGQMNLEELHLNDNRLTITSLQPDVRLDYGPSDNLRILNVSNNFLSQLPVHSKFTTSVKELYYQNNTIRTMDKNGLNRLNNLKVLNLSHNQLKIIGANTFSSNGQLKFLDVSNNTLVYIAPDNFQHFTNMTSLILNKNNLDEKFVDCDNLQNLGNMQVLDLSFNQISKIYNCSFSKMKSLTKLSLLANQLKEIPPSTFDSLTKLQELDLAQNKISDLPKDLFDALKQLQKLNISDNNLKKFDSNLLIENRKLAEFDIKGNDLTDSDLAVLKSQLPSLKALEVNTDVTKCKKYDDIMDYFNENGRKIWIVVTIVSVILGILVTVVIFLTTVVCCKLFRYVGYPRQAPILSDF